MIAQFFAQNADGQWLVSPFLFEAVIIAGMLSVWLLLARGGRNGSA